MAERDFNEEITTMNGNTVAINTLSRASLGRLAMLLIAAGVVALALLLGGKADQANAKSEIFVFNSFPSSTQAGGHPDIFTEFELGSRLSTNPPVPCFCNDPKEVIQKLPAGVIANPHVVAECKIAQLALFDCPADAQAGISVLQLFGAYAGFPLYRTTPFKGQAAVFAFLLPFGSAAPQYLTFNPRTGSDYGLTVRSVGISHLLPLQYYAPVFWGVPNDPFYNIMRFRPSSLDEQEKQGFQCSSNPFQAMVEHDVNGLKVACPVGLPNRDVPSSLPIAPMNQNPTTCAGPLTTTMEVFSYDLEWTYAETEWPETTGCDGLSFDPSLAANPTTTSTDTASGLEVELSVPQFQDPKVPSPSELKASTVTLPDGFSLNPSAVDGKTVCTDEQSRVGTEEEAQCPEFSKIGTVVLDSSALPAPINGFIYIGEPKPGEPYRIVVTANGFGTAVKLLGTIDADAGDGQLVTSFPDLPQTPFQKFVMHFFGSERGLLATPTHCDKYPVNSSFTPWASELSEQRVTQFFVLDQGPNGTPCPAGQRPFSPRFEAGSQDNTAGKHSSFALKLTREDGEQNIGDLTVTAPPGFLASLRGVEYCPEGAIAKLSDPSYTGAEETASPACPASSEVGTAAARSGAGTKPLNTPGSVYLAGPYKGAPLSLVVNIPAIAGPYDLGNVAVRVAVHVDPASTQVSAVSDPLPQIFEGVPLRTRLIQVNLNRPNFALNPTNCREYSVDASVGGTEGGRASVSAPFQVANCTDLAYQPKLSMKLSGGVNRLGHPAIRAVLRTSPNEANSQRVSVTLPGGELLDNKHIGTVCTRAQFAADSCPAASRIGSATARSQLLENPVSGGVYLRASNHRLPDLVADLEGQVDVELSAKIDTAKGGRLRATFGSIPDVPVERFVMNLQGGKKGLLQNSRGLCGKKKRAKVAMVGQNGWRIRERIPLQVACGSKAKRKRHAKHSRQRAATAGTVR
jgi:hypothetical protein